MTSYLNHTPCQQPGYVELQKLWIFYYIPTHYSSVPFRSLLYYIPGLIILTRKQDIVIVEVFLTSTIVFLNHFAPYHLIRLCPHFKHRRDQKTLHT